MSNYANKDVKLLKEVLKEVYPKELIGIADNKAMWVLLTVLKKSKEFDWMDEDWRVNANLFLKEYIGSAEPRYLVGSVYKLKDRVKDWREQGGTKKKNPWVETG